MPSALSMVERISEPGAQYADKRPIIIQAMTWMTVLATVTFILRVWSRRTAKQKLGADDWLALGALVFEYGTFALYMLLVAEGVGTSTAHIRAQPDAVQRLDIIAQSSLAVEPVVATALACLKSSVLALYLRIFPTHYIRYSGYALGTIVVLGWIGTVGVGLVGCIDLTASEVLHGSNCVQLRPDFMIAVTVLSFVMDVIVLLLPLPEIIRLKMKPWQKLTVGGLFSLGSLSAVTNWIRWAIISAHRNNPVRDDLGGISGIFVVLEICAGIIGACLSTVRPLMRSLWSRCGWQVSSKGEADHARPLVTAGSFDNSGHMMGRYQLPIRAHDWSSDDTTSSIQAHALDDLAEPIAINCKV
ncbi:hypothetical protein F5Y15DRAFT_248688 [Xylariaceae sp. FL0016]|nr:hypothetical protein F5Y15DRAFT_248688 [Xylariaceae sp. FL0016]